MMESGKSLIMQAKHLKGFVVLQLVAIICCHVANGLAEQRSSSDSYLKELAPFGGSTEASSMVKTSLSSVHEQRLANDREQLLADEQVEDQAATALPQYNLRYDIRGIDQDNSNYRPNDGQWELARVGELLEALSMSLSPAPPPAASSEQVQRSGRTYLFGGSPDRRQVSASSLEPSPSYTQAGAYNRYTGQQQPMRHQAALLINGKQQPQIADLANEQRLQRAQEGSAGPLGLALWPPTTRTMSSGPIIGVGGPKNANARRSHMNPRHTSDTAEVAIHTPLHSRSVSDYEWKRVENSRWNNLRGMWGKRSVQGEDHVNRKQEQHEAPSGNLM